MKMPWCGGIAEMFGSVQLRQNPLEMAVLERQQMQLRQEQEQQQQINATNGDPSNLQAQPFVAPACFPPAMAGDFPKDLQLHGLMQLHAWPDMLQYPIMGELEHPSSNLGSGSNTINGTSTNVECPPNGYAEELSSSGLRKRKAERPQTPPVNGVDSEDKKVNGEKKVRCDGSGGVVLHQPKQEVQTSNSKSGKAASKAASEVLQKPDYVHVRARRGQATDSHSLAERVRREKISERMKYLQDLVPGCNKITGKAGMLDVIINYVQSLQKQVEFLSMKLAAANPVFDFSALELSVLKENIAASSGGLRVTMAMPPDPMSSPLASSSSMVQPATPNGGLGLALNLQEVQLNNTAGDPATAPPNYTMDVHNFNVAGANSSPGWDATLQNILPVANFNAMPIDPNYQTTSGCNID